MMRKWRLAALSSLGPCSWPPTISVPIIRALVHCHPHHRCCHRCHHHNYHRHLLLSHLHIHTLLHHYVVRSWSCLIYAQLLMAMFAISNTTNIQRVRHGEHVKFQNGWMKWDPIAAKHTANKLWPVLQIYFCSCVVIIMNRWDDLHEGVVYWENKAGGSSWGHLLTRLRYTAAKLQRTCEAATM